MDPILKTWSTAPSCAESLPCQIDGRVFPGQSAPGQAACFEKSSLQASKQERMQSRAMSLKDRCFMAWSKAAVLRTQTRKLHQRVIRHLEADMIHWVGINPKS